MKPETKKIYQFYKRTGQKLTGELIKEKEYDGVNYYFLKDETGKIHQINPKKAELL